MGLHYILTVVKGPLRGVGGIPMETPNDQGVVDTEPEAALPDVQGKSNHALEAFPGSNGFCIKYVQERVDCTIACGQLLAVLVYCVAVANASIPINELFRTIREDGDLLWGKSCPPFLEFSRCRLLVETPGGVHPAPVCKLWWPELRSWYTRENCAQPLYLCLWALSSPSPSAPSDHWGSDAFD